MLAVRDTGVGISAEKLDNVFLPFNKNVDNRQLNKYGVGLGLPISKNLSKALGGELTAASQLGIGSTFTLFLYNVTIKQSS